MRRERSRERGAISVEFGFCVLMGLLPLFVGGLHLGRALGVKHRLGDATGYAARAAAVARTSNPATVRALLVDRLGTTAEDCSSVVVTSFTAGAVPYRRLEVTARCNLKTPFGGDLLGDIGLDHVSTTASMPF